MVKVLVTVSFFPFLWYVNTFVLCLESPSCFSVDNILLHSQHLVMNPTGTSFPHKKTVLHSYNCKLLAYTITQHYHVLATNQCALHRTLKMIVLLGGFQTNSHFLLFTLVALWWHTSWYTLSMCNVVNYDVTATCGCVVGP